MDYIKTKWREIITILLGLSIVIGRVIIPTKNEITVSVVLIELAIEIVVLLVAIFMNKEKLKKILDEIKNDNIKNILKKSVVVPLCIIPTIIIVSIITQIIGIEPKPLNMISDKFFDVFALGAFLSMVVVAPLSEEIIFRLSFKDLIPNKTLFVVISSFFFGFIHDWFYFSSGIFEYFAAGVVLCLLYLKREKLHYNIFGHYLNNLIATGLPILLSLLK